ncbi:hypothetical protein H5410_034604 [Solanum commersonii]|uniref:Uncharacterized protein n=1 Tax=Solanum commersonii TaxID=4109 RepID=A0A9J5YS61_SOLCO|nr:hypothetical protein H5410_034604 [Solanum commersonii]
MQRHFKRRRKRKQHRREMDGTWTNRKVITSRRNSWEMSKKGA